MNIAMVGLDYNKAPIELREQLSFTKTERLDAMAQMVAHPNVMGVVLVSTCNRTEVYLSWEGEFIDPGVLLCQVTGASYQRFAPSFVLRQECDCINHLMAVSCGLQSQILGEDQILTQVKEAAAMAREIGAIDATLESLFSAAIACGKAVKSQLHITNVATSAAHGAVLALEQAFTALVGKKALVIGNGEMGRLACDLLVAKGVQVWVTLRTYRHGETVVPRGCGVVEYQQRYDKIPQVDMVISATTSPHHTVTLERLSAVAPIPSVFVDLSIPRDIDPQCNAVTKVFNVDDLGSRLGLDDNTQAQLEAIMAPYIQRFYHWQQYRHCMPAVEELKQAVLGRMTTPQEQAAAVKTVDLLMAGFAQNLTAEGIYQCASGIRDRTR